MAHEGQTDGATQPEASQKPGYKPSFGFKLGLAGLAGFAALLAIAGFLGSSREPGTQAATSSSTPIPTVAISYAPRKTTPPDDYVRVIPGDPTPVVAGVAVTPAVATAAPVTGSSSGAQQTVPAPIASSTVSPPTPIVGDAASVTPSVGDAWTATPAPTDTPSTSELTPVAATFADKLEESYDVRILRSGQDWGDDQAEQMRNLTALSTALQAVPEGLRDAVVANGGGSLAFLSNDHGRTEAGWQPYGDRAANYYTNEDQTQSGAYASNQIVLQPGSTAQTVAHEMMHAFQMRDVAPGAYVQALLSPEMKSFMAATGWRQLVSDDELRLSSNQSWDAINGMFAYDGRTLAFLNEYGNMSALYAPNPIEAFAEAGGLYYAHSFAMEVPDWPEYWGWFNANIG